MNQTIYEAAGGREAFITLAHAWHARCLADAVVSHAFSHGYHPQHTERLAAYWAEALAGRPPTARRSVTRRRSPGCTRATASTSRWTNVRKCASRRRSMTPGFRTTRGCGPRSRLTFAGPRAAWRDTPTRPTTSPSESRSRGGPGTDLEITDVGRGGHLESRASPLDRSGSAARRPHHVWRSPARSRDASASCRDARPPDRSSGCRPAVGNTPIRVPR